ncbi:phosphate ABC transporter permease subunit PstC [Cohnella fermenti]|uniref:Phosphate transport system permease protein n=1 Tax=Cohnella fermenti TaxID=2565925 RepID=A0A4S4BND8_9BACL|nr:phosphate ABC transporter permease subunit PstC [Cohnella fermenti]THF75470.1 phosphate ABC transporter permease subunit PstC [Cohnella fermenti]
MNLPVTNKQGGPPGKSGKWGKHVIEEARGRAFVYFCVLLMVVTIFSIVFFIASRGLTPFISQGVSVKDMLFGLKWKPEGNPPLFGALPFLFGSFVTSVLAALIAAPLGFCASIFMTEIMPKFGRTALQPAIELLAGIPSVVYGFVGLSVVVPFLRDVFPGQGIGILAGAIVLSVMILPTVTTIGTDALRSLPSGLKEGSYALGATRWQTIYRLILPTALPSLLTGVVLGIARAFGEALAVQMVIGNAPHIPRSLFESATTLTSIITLEMGNTTSGSLHNNALWSLALILLLMTFLFVFVVRMLERRVKR